MVQAEMLKEEMRHARMEQNQLYEKHVYAKIVAGEDTESISVGYHAYISSLQGFDVNAFDRTVHKIMHDDDEQVIDRFAEGFKSIPDYLVERNNWSERIKEIMSSDSDVASKQALVDSMDRTRTNAHNGVINLFNNLNQYADDNSIPRPYPMKYDTFRKDNLEHRADVADILTRQTTLLESTQEHVWEKFASTGKTQTQADKLDEVFRSKGLGGLMQEVNRLKSTEESLDELSDFSKGKNANEL